MLMMPFFFSSRRRHTSSLCDWSSDVCSSDLRQPSRGGLLSALSRCDLGNGRMLVRSRNQGSRSDRKSTRLNSSHTVISYAVFCLKKKKKKNNECYIHQNESKENTHIQMKKHD